MRCMLIALRSSLFDVCCCYAFLLGATRGSSKGLRDRNESDETRNLIVVVSLHPRNFPIQRAGAYYHASDNNVNIYLVAKGVLDALGMRRSVFNANPTPSLLYHYS